MGFSRPEYWSRQPFPSPDLPNPWIEPRSPTLQADSSAAEPPGKPKNTGVGNPSLLQWIFLNQESNQPRSPAFQADSLPAKLPGKPIALNSWHIFFSIYNTEENDRLPRWLSGKESTCNADLGLILASGRPLEKKMATHSSILAWEIPWTEEPGGSQSIGSQE